MFTAALFTIARAWMPPKCPSIEKRIKMRYIYTMEYYPAIKGAKLCHLQQLRMNPEIATLSEVSQKEKDNISYDIIHMWNLICLKKKQKQRYQK